MVVHYDCLEWARRNTQQAPPAAAHIKERAVISVKPAKCITAADGTSITYFAHLAKIIVHFKHYAPGTFGHTTTTNEFYPQKFPAPSPLRIDRRRGPSGGQDEGRA